MSDPEDPGLEPTPPAPEGEPPPVEDTPPSTEGPSETPTPEAPPDEDPVLGALGAIVRALDAMHEMIPMPPRVENALREAKGHLGL